MATLVRSAGVAAAVASLLAPSIAFSQLEEIVVTAQRRETNLQETPISIQAFTAEDLELGGIEQGSDIGIMTPNLVANPGGGGGSGATQFYVRGLPGVGVYIDGVWQGPFGFQQTDFVELERIEVLRGPQGTLFGRNTNGGAINITTRLPADEFGARMDLSIGEFDRRDLTLAVDVPISDTLRTKWMAASLNNDGFLQSTTTSRALGGRDDTLFRGDVLWQPTDTLSLRLTLNDEEKRSTLARIVRFTDTTHPRYVAYNVLANNPDYIAMAGPDFEVRDMGFGLSSPGFTPETHQTNLPGGQLGKWETRSDTMQDGSIADVRYATVTVDWDITDNLHLESITSGWEMDRRSVTDFDGSEFTITTDDYRNHDKNFTQEFHLTGSNVNDRVNWLAGLYYLDQEETQRFYRWMMWEFGIPNEGPTGPVPNPETVGYIEEWAAAANYAPLFRFAAPPQLPPLNLVGASSDALTRNEDEDRAFFGEVTVSVTDRLDLTYGIRYTADDGRAIELTPTSGFRSTGPHIPIQGDPFAGVVASVEEDADLGTIRTNRYAVTYQVTDDLMLYGSWGEGFTSGEVIIDENFPEPIVLDPEIVATTEIGMRSDWLDGGLRFNATYFTSDWDGLRVPVLPPPDPETGVQPPFPVNTSEGKAEASGFEFEFIWAPSDRWLVDAGLGLIDTEYLELGDIPEDGTGLQPGLPFAYAPDVSASIGLQYDMPLQSGGHVLFVANYGWMDEYVRDPANQRIPQTEDGEILFEPAYGILNARVLIEPEDQRWNLSFWGRNLTDEWYVNGGFDAREVWGYDFAVIGRSREVGMTLGFTF
ncbi:MAG TPA: TonB-dependent receptor [Gammaproteobacteria bacterium]